MLTDATCIFEAKFSGSFYILWRASGQHTAALNIKNGVYFYVNEFVPKCLYEELPGETIIKGDYLHEQWEKKPLRLKVTDPNMFIIFDKKVEGSGRFATPSSKTGIHKICLSADEPRPPWPRKDKTAKVYLKIEIHSKEIEEPSDLAQVSHISALQKELQSLEARLDYILTELDYSEKQEVHFQDQSERINTRIIYWSLLQILLLITCAFWQIAHLKSFFRAKKLV